MNGEKLNNFLKVSLIILNLFVVNTYVILFSILSIGILTPALLGASFCEIESILDYDMVGINKRFFLNIKNNLKYVFGKIFIAYVFLIITLLSLLFFNKMVADSYSPYVYAIIVCTQLVVAFELINIIQVALIQIFVLENKDVNKVLRNSFVIVNTNLLRFLLANISLVIAIVLLNKLSIFILLFISLSIALYYISVIGRVKTFCSKYQ